MPPGKPIEKGNRIGFKPGQYGTPAGWTKSVKFLSKAYRSWIAQPSERDPEGEQACNRLLKEAARLNPALKHYAVGARGH